MRIRVLHWGPPALRGESAGFKDSPWGQVQKWKLDNQAQHPPSDDGEGKGGPRAKVRQCQAWTRTQVNPDARHSVPPSLPSFFPPFALPCRPRPRVFASTGGIYRGFPGTCIPDSAELP